MFGFPTRQSKRYDDDEFDGKRNFRGHDEVAETKKKKEQRKITWRKFAADGTLYGIVSVRGQDTSKKAKGRTKFRWRKIHS